MYIVYCYQNYIEKSVISFGTRLFFSWKYSRRKFVIVRVQYRKLSQFWIKHLHFETPHKFYSYAILS